MARSENRTAEEMYLARVVKRDGCWGWAGCIDKRGYSVFNKDGIKPAHRLSYLMHKGPIPDGLDVMHMCHNPSCSNPDHLELGTRRENMATSFVVGRLQRRIPLADMPRIAADRAAGMTLQAIGDRYGCTKQAVRHMLNAHPELCHG